MTTRFDRSTGIASGAALQGLLVQVTREGRIVSSRTVPDGNGAAAGGAPSPAPPAPGESLLPWLAAVLGADEAGTGSPPAPLVLAVHPSRDGRGAALLIEVRRHGAGPEPAGTGRGADPGRAADAAPQDAPAYPRRLVGFKRRRMFLFDPARVLCFELRTGLVHATLDDGEAYTTNYTIRELTGRLLPAEFFRIHRDVIVNLNRVREIERMGLGRLRLLLEPPDGRGFLVSRPASARLRRLLRF